MYNRIIMYKTINGWAELELKNFPDNHFDALITDPPAGISFMGKEWDSLKGSPAKWIEWLTGIMQKCYRILKPGAHGFVWASGLTSLLQIGFLLNRSLII